MKPAQNSKLLNVSQQSSKKNPSKQIKNLKKSPDPTNTLLNKRIVSPQKLKILVLSGNQLQNNQLDFLSKCINLIKLDLSHNHITKFHEKFGIKNIANLRVLNLEANKLYGLQAIEALFGMQSLEVFSYKDNPIEQNSKAAHFIINGFPNLKVVNYRIIFVEERDPFLISQRKNQFISNNFEQWQPTQHSEKYYLKVLKLQLQYVDNMWMFHNPIVKIQRIWRAILEERQFLQKQKTISVKGKNTIAQSNLRKASKFDQSFEPTQKSILFQCFNQWKNMARTIKTIRQQLHCTTYESPQSPYNKPLTFQDKQYLTYDLQNYYLMKRNLKIKNHYKRFLQKIRFKLYLKRMVQIFRRNIKLRQLSFADPLTSYYKISGLAQSKRIYFNRVQQHLIENFLAHIAKNFNKTEQIYAKGNFAVATQYVAVRLMDPDTYSSKTVYNPLTYLIWPCMRSVILRKKKFPFKQKSSLIKLKSLTYIKNLNKRLTPQQILKSNKTYNRIDKFFQHEYYESLGYYQCQDDFVMQQIIRMIFYHNTKALQFQKIIQRSQMMSLLQSYTENVSIYTEKLLQRTTSAVKIQQQWRKYINNKKQKQSIYDKLKKNRASRLIQRFIRDRVFYHRLAFQRNLSLDLSAFDDRDLLIHQELYKKLPEIVQQAQRHIELYKGFKIQIKDTIKLFHQQFNEKEIFSPKLRQLHFASSRFALTNERPSSSDKKVDIYCFFHQNSNVKIIQCKGEKFYQFTFQKIQDAKLRVACLALLTYRIYGGHYLLLLSKSTLHMYNQRIQCYKNYNVNCKPFVMTSQEQNFNKLKVNLISDISHQTRCSFMYMDINYELLFTKSDLLRTYYLPVEFYQKRYQNYPQKYSAILKIILNDEEGIKEKEIEQKFMSIQKMLIKQSQFTDTNRDQFERVNKDTPRTSKEITTHKMTKVNIITSTMELNREHTNSMLEKQPKSLEESLNLHTKNFSKLQMNIMKTSQKHLSLYQIDTSIKQQTEAKKSYKTLIEQSQSIKRDKVAKFLESTKEKRDFFREKKEIDLGQVRQKRKFQKVMNMTLKSFNQIQRTQVLRKKAEKVKQYKRRSLSSSKADETQFMQQGNFIMEQQLKMNLMRNRIKQVEKIKQKRSSLPKSLNNTQSIHNHSEQTKSIRSNHSLRQKKMLFEGKDMQIIEFDKKILPSASLEKHSNEIFGGQTQVINKRSYVKKRSSKVGAYLRDPSLVHGVFPQQYYPIESGKGGIVFPRMI